MQLITTCVDTTSYDSEVITTMYTTTLSLHDALPIARRRDREHGRPDGEGSGDQDLRYCRGRHDHRDGAGAGDLPRGAEVGHRGRQPDVAEARHRQGGRVGGGGAEADLRTQQGPEGDRAGRDDLSEQR